MRLNGKLGLSNGKTQSLEVRTLQKSLGLDAKAFGTGIPKTCGCPCGSGEVSGVR